MRVAVDLALLALAGAALAVTLSRPPTALPLRPSRAPFVVAPRWCRGAAPIGPACAVVPGPA